MYSGSLSAGQGGSNLLGGMSMARIFDEIECVVPSCFGETEQNP